MTMTSNTATESTDNGVEGETPEPSEHETDASTATATDEDGDAEGSNVTDERLKFYQRKARENEQELKKLRKVEDERQRAELSEVERLKTDLDARDAELSELKGNALRSRISAEHGLDAELAERLRGDTEEELAEDAARLAELVGKRKPKAPAAADAGIGVQGGDSLPTDPVELARRFTAGR